MSRQPKRRTSLLDSAYPTDAALQEALFRVIKGAEDQGETFLSEDEIMKRLLHLAVEEEMTEMASQGILTKIEKPGEETVYEVNRGHPYWRERPSGAL